MYVLAVTTTFTVLSVLFVTLRLWTRLRIAKAAGCDDVFILAALLANLPFYAFVLLELHYDLGVPRSGMPDNVAQHQLLFLWLSIPFYNLTLILAKISALCFFIRLFRSRQLLIVSYFVMSFLVVSGLWMILSGFVFCIPVHHFWTAPSYQSRTKHCLPEGPVWFTNSGIQTFTDLVILIMPMPLLSKLHMPRPQKIGIMVVFGIGIFVVVASSVRMYELSVMVGSGKFTKKNKDTSVWSSLEANLSIICSCLPPLHPLFSRIFSLCFLPQPLHSSPASKTHSHTTHLTSSRKASIYDHTGPGIGADGGVFYNDLFIPGPGSYSASISGVGTREDDAAQNEGGIRVVRELRLQASAFERLSEAGSDLSHVWDLEKGEQSNHSGSANGHSGKSIEWELDDFEFPDYKERLNSPI